MRTISIALAVLALLFAAPAEARRIAITIDDAPREDGPVFAGPARAAHIIEALKRAKAPPVAFFVVTSRMSTPEGRARIEAYANAGDLIANHSHTHSWAHSMSVEAYVAEIDQAEAILKGLPNRRPWFRYPYLDEGGQLEKRDQIRAALAARGLMSGYVTVDDYDWYLAQRWKEAIAAGRKVDRKKLKALYIDLLTDAADYYDALAVKYLGRSPAHVLLIHENDLAASFIGDLIAAYRAKGWEIVSPDVAFADPLAQDLPTTTFSGMGRIAAVAAERGLDRRTLEPWFSDEAQIDAKIAERGVFGPPG